MNLGEFANALAASGTEHAALADGDEAVAARLKMRKEQAGLSHREDIQTFVDFIDADEKRI